MLAALLGGIPNRARVSAAVTRPVQNESAPITSPPARVESDCQMPDGGRLTQLPCPFRNAPAGSPSMGLQGHDWIESLTNRTEPSPIKTFRPPGCMLEAELVQAVVGQKGNLIACIRWVQ